MSYQTGDSLQVRIRIAFGARISDDPSTWTWTDVTRWWHTPDDVTIDWGRSAGADKAETAKLALTLKNTDGRFTAYDPRSPYWPNVVKWTPISYDIDLGDGAGWRNRFSGFIRRWPLTWPGATPFMALAKLEAVGVLGRVGRGKPPARSPMRRTIRASAPVAYWPFEDGGDAGQAASALPGQLAASVRGTVEFQQVTDLIYTAGGQQDYGTAPLPNLAKGGSLQAVLPPAAVAATRAGQWSIQCTAEANIGTTDNDLVLMDWFTPGGTYTRWQLWQRKFDFSTMLTVYSGAVPQAVLFQLDGSYSSFIDWRVTAQQSGGNVVVRFYQAGPTPAAQVTFAGTLGGVAAIRLNSASSSDTTNRIVFGHLAVWATANPSLPIGFIVDSYGHGVFAQDRAYDGEAAHLRLARLCAEDGVPIVVTPVPDDVDATRMGRQPTGTALDLYNLCERTDQGLLYESGFGLGYLPRAARYNRPVALTIDAAQGQLGTPFEPVDDDQQLRNQWTISRTGGSSAVAADLESIDAQGEIEGTDSINVHTDMTLPDHAAWRLRLTTAREPRYGQVSLNLAAHRELAAAWASCQPGSRIQVINPPKQNVPGSVDQLIVGARETYKGRRSWRVSMNVVPASPWRVAEADGEQRVPADGSTLAAAVTAGGTVAVADAFTSRTVPSGFGTAETGGPWAVEGTAAEYSVSNSRARMSITSVLVSRRAIVGPTLTDSDVAASVFAPPASGADIQPMLAMRWTDNNNAYLFVAELRPDRTIIAAIEKRVAGVQTNLAKAPTGLTHTGGGAGIRLRARCAGSVLQLRLWRHGTTEPDTWHVTVTDPSLTSGRTALRVILAGGNTNALPLEVSWDDVTAYDATQITIASTAANGPWTTQQTDFPMDVMLGGERIRISAITGTTSPQTATVAARGVNGFRRDWPAGTPVDVADPAIVAL